MNFLLRGRSPWFQSDQSRPHAVEPAPETVAAVTGLPVAAPAPEGGTDDLRASGVCAGCMARERERDGAMEAARANGAKTEQAKAAWYREKGRADRAETTLAEILATFEIAKNSVTGEVIGYLAQAPIHPDDFARWRAAQPKETR